MDLRTLEIFCKVVENRSFSQTAEEMSITQPTVSFQMHNLEKYFGTKLFDRSTRELNLTKEGETLYEYAHKILELGKAAKESVAGYKNLNLGELVIGASTIPGEYILPAKLKLFKKKFPRIKVILRIADTEKIISQVLERKLDIGVVGARVEHKNLSYEEFVEDELVLIVSPKHRWAKIKHISLADLEKEPFIIREKGSGTRTTMLTALREKRLALEDLNIVMELGSTESVKTAVKAGIGVSLVSKWAIKDELKLRRLRALKIRELNLFRYFYIVYDQRRILSKAVKSFHQFLIGTSTV